MSLQALDWISSKLGLNITGRDDKGTTSLPSRDSDEMECFDSSKHLFTTTFEKDFGRGDDESSLAKYWKQVNEKVSSCIGGQSGTVRNFFQTLVNDGNESSLDRNVNANLKVDEAVNNDLDENGLPVTKNWYYYDSQIGRWNVLPDAPEAIRQEYKEKLIAEANRAEQTKIAPPPPPVMDSQYTNGSNPSWSSGEVALKGSFVPMGANGRGIQNRTTTPRYSVPDYFNTAPPPPAMETRNPPPTATVPPPGGVYGSYASFGQPSAQGPSDLSAKLTPPEIQLRANLPSPPPLVHYRQAPAMPLFHKVNPTPPNQVTNNPSLRPPTASFLAGSSDDLVWPPLPPPPPPPSFALNPTSSGLLNPPSGPPYNGPSLAISAGYGAGVNRYEDYATAAPSGNASGPPSVGGFPPCASPSV